MAINWGTLVDKLDQAAELKICSAHLFSTHLVSNWANPHKPNYVFATA